MRDIVAIHDRHPHRGRTDFYPTMLRTNARVPALKGILGAAALTSLQYNATYLDHDLGPGAAAHSLKFHTNAAIQSGPALRRFENTPFSNPPRVPPNLSFGHGDSGQPVTPGVAQPNVALTTLSATHGAAGRRPRRPRGGRLPPSRCLWRRQAPLAASAWRTCSS